MKILNIVLLQILLSMVIQAHTSIYVKQFDPTALVYTEHLEDVMFVKGIFRIRTVLSMEDSVADLQLANRLTQNFIIRCQNHDTNDSQMRKSLNNALSSLTWLIQNTMRRIPRHRRDNLLYDGLHYLFGLDNDAYEDISDIQDDQEKMANADS